MFDFAWILEFPSLNWYQAGLHSTELTELLKQLFSQRLLFYNQGDLGTIVTFRGSDVSTCYWTAFCVQKCLSAVSSPGMCAVSSCVPGPLGPVLDLMDLVLTCSPVVPACLLCLLLCSHSMRQRQDSCLFTFCDSRPQSQVSHTWTGVPGTVLSCRTMLQNELFDIPNFAARTRTTSR
jgi:hypothetical protein